MKYLILLNLLFCSIVVNAQVAEGTAIRTKLQFIKKDMKVDVKITLQYKVVSDKPLLIGNLRDYYGTPSLGKFMTALSGSKGTVVSKKANADSIYIVPAGKEVNFTYTLTYDSAALTDNTYAPNTGEDHVHFAFCQWMLPITEREKILEYDIQVDKLPANWKLYSSIGGESMNISFSNSLDEYYSSIIGAGIFYKKSYVLRGHPLNVYVNGHFNIGEEKIAALVYKTVNYQHTLFNDFNFKFYTVVLLPKEGNIAGISIPGMFLCHVKKNVEYQKLAWLMSHEMLHRWVGNQLYIKDTTSFGLRHQWFKEGINDYLAYLALLDSKLYTKDDLVNSINNYIKNIQENPYRDASEDSTIVLANEGKYGVAAVKLAYYKGMLIGFIADHAFLKEYGTGLQSRVRDFIAGLLKNEQTGIEEQAFFSLADSMQLPLRELYESHIILGSSDLDLPRTVFAGTYELKKISYQRYDPGFTSARKNGKLYISTTDISGAAYKAGAREGMEIISSTITNRFSGAWCDCPVKIVLLMNGKHESIEYMPKGALLEAWQYVKKM